MHTTRFLSSDAALGAERAVAHSFAEPCDESEQVIFPLTLAVITRNEAASIGACLDSVTFAAEKLVVDCGSADGTQAIAAKHGARVVHQDWLGFGAQRNFAASIARHEWILMLDADEEFTPALTQELRACLPALMRSAHAGAILNRSTLYMGKPMRWYRPMRGERIARLYHRQRARWTLTRVHESLRFDGSTLSLKHPFIHHYNPTLVHKQLKTLRYTELKLQDWLERGKPSQLWACPFIFVATFAREYVGRWACLDGARGYIVAQTEAAYAVYKRMRYFEIRYHAPSGKLARDFLRRHDFEP